LQSAESVKLIIDNDDKDALFIVSSDRFCRKIISHIIGGQKSAKEISNESGIPIGTVYRKIHLLKKQKLLKITGIITPDAKKAFYYKSRIKTICTKYENGVLDVEIIPNCF
jgi:predicted AAA+ superfamily ATPase|tara:strand:+ start:377 stop:709 length:333 start_codon:yes stop_codon:yes gene_type:complete